MVIPATYTPAAFELNEEQHVVGYQPAQCQDLGGEEVNSRQQLHVGRNKVHPRGRALAFRRRRQTVASQDIADRLIANCIPQIGQRPSDPVIAPATVLTGQSYDQLLDLPLDPGST